MLGLIEPYLRANNHGWQIELACHVSSFILHRARLGCAWNICIGSTRQEQHSARPSAISCERSGPGSPNRPSENSFSLQRTESVNAGVTMMAIHIIDIWDTFFDNPVGITRYWQATRLTFSMTFWFDLLQNKMQKCKLFVIWTASSEFGTYRLCEQRRFRRACASAQSRQNLRCSLIQAVNQEEPSDRKPKPDLWPLWMAGHAQLKFVMTECSKTQIRLTGLIYSYYENSAATHKNSKWSKTFLQST